MGQHFLCQGRPFIRQRHGRALPAGADLPDVDHPIDEMAAVVDADRSVTTADQRAVFAAAHDRVAGLIAEYNALSRDH